MSRETETLKDYDALGLQRFKEWIIERAQEDGISIPNAYIRFYRGQYRPIKRHRINRRVIYVENVRA